VPLPESLRLGWRLVPGQALSYDIELRHRQPGLIQTRTERWTYRVRARERGVCTLHGHLIGLGGHLDPAEPQVADAVLGPQRRQGDRVVLRLGVDGRLRPQPGMDCASLDEPDRDCFGRQIAHRLLALPLPDQPVAPGATWPDDTLAEPFLPLLPDALQPAVDGRCALSDVYRDADGSPRVDLHSTLLVRTQGGLALRAEGLTAWDPLAGELARRTLHARLGGGLGPPVGELTLTLTRRS